MGFGKQGTGAILRSNENIALATLADNTAIKFSSNITLSEDFRVLRADILCHITTVTQGEGTGLVLGACNDELTVAEIAETLVADGPSDRNDRVVQERTERKVDLLSSGIENEGSVIFLGDDGGTVIHWKPRWTFSDPEGWAYFIWNHSGSTLNTGMQARLMQTVYGVWVT